MRHKVTYIFVLASFFMFSGTITSIFSLAAPYIGLGEQREFVLYIKYGLARLEVFKVGVAFIIVGAGLWIGARSLILLEKTYGISSAWLHMKLVFRNWAEKRSYSIVNKPSVWLGKIIAFPFLGLHKERHVVLTASFIVLSLFLLRFIQIHDVGQENGNNALLYSGFDGSFHISRLAMSQIWSIPSINFGSNPTLANGGTVHQVNDYLIPQHLIVNLIPELFSPITLIFLFLVEVFFAIYLLFRVFDLSRWVSFFAAWLTCLINFPLTSYPLAYFGFFSVPHMSHLFSMGFLLLACFWYLGKGNWSRNLMISVLMAVVGFLVLISSFHRAPLISVYLITIGPFILLFALPNEYLPKLFYSFIAIFIISLSGIFHVYDQIELIFYFPASKQTSIIELLMQTAEALFLPDFHSLGRHFTEHALTPAIGTPLAHPAVRLIQFIALLSAMIGIFVFPRRSEKMICAVAIVFIWYLANNQSSHRSRVYFFESHGWPFLSASLAIGIREALLIFRRLQFRRTTPLVLSLPEVRGLPYYLVVLVSLGLFLTNIDNSKRWSQPIIHNKVTKLLHDRIGMSPGEVFQGNYVSSVGWHEEGAVNAMGEHWPNIVARVDYEILKKTGTDIRTTFPMSMSIPTLFSNFSLNNPYYKMYFVTDPFSNNQIPLSTLATFQKKNNILWLMGTRYFITDEILDLPVTLEMPVENLGTIYVYEFNDANLGYSPAETEGYDDFTEYLQPLVAGRLNPRKVTAVEPQYAGRYVTADKIQYTLERGGFRIRAHSTGRSIVVVPYSYSACLVPEIKSGENVELIRANVMNTAVIFEGSIDVKVEYWFGPFKNKNCIKEDLLFAHKVLDMPEIDYAEK